MSSRFAWSIRASSRRGSKATEKHFLEKTKKQKIKTTTTITNKNKTKTKMSGCLTLLQTRLPCSDELYPQTVSQNKCFFLEVAFAKYFPRAIRKVTNVTTEEGSGETGWSFPISNVCV